MFGRSILDLNRGVWVLAVLFLHRIALAQVDQSPADIRGDPASKTEAARAGDQQRPMGAPEAQTALKHVIAPFSAAAVIHPRSVLKSASSQVLPIEMLQSLLAEGPSIDISQVEELVLLFGVHWSSGDMSFAVVCRFTDGFQRDTIMAHLDPVERQPQGGVPVIYRWKDIQGFCAAFAEDQTLILAQERLLRDMFFSKHITGPLAKHLAAGEDGSAVRIVCASDTLHEFLGPLLGGLTDPSVETEGLDAAVELLTAVELDIASDDDAEMKLVLKAHDADSASKLDEKLAGMLRSAGRLFEADIDAARESGATRQEIDLIKYYQRLVSRLANSVERRRDGDQLVLGINSSALAAAGCGVLLGEFAADIGFVVADVSSEAPEPSRMNLKSIAAAMSEYQRVHHTFPRSSMGPDGTPLLSWRVHLLPFLGKQELYERFHLDEPWDSEHNQPLLSEIPDVYRSSELLAEGRTLYLLATEAATLFTPNDKDAVDQPHFQSEAEKILVVEANMARASEWTKPELFAFDPADIFAGLGGLHPGGFFALQADGFVDFVPFITAADELRSRFDRQAPQTVEKPGTEKK